MKILIHNGHLLDPASGFDAKADLAIADGKVVAMGQVSKDFHADKQIDASNCWIIPGLVDACARLGEPGHEHEGMLQSELTAAVAGGITSVVCLPDTQPVLDEPGLVEMLQFRAKRLHLANVYPLGALTRGLQGEVLTPMVELTQAGCVGFTQAEFAISNTQSLQRAMQYAATFGYAIWLRAQDSYLGKGIVASGPLATRMGLSGVPAAAKNLLARTSTLSNQYSVLGRHRLHKVGDSAPPTETPAQANIASRPNPAAQPAVEETASITSMGIPQFLKRMSMGILSK